ncbi:hypothetical protein GDO86_007764 [Hymenochirus boettgeri]|uniref:PDZ domain-containing protein n=1 Tax=Hymenochirus boettgeri TaxID=247094 RepID=A0A8T2IXX9_9PIPI|nr:hypothetical protein GDO86_007764 [Hymenochirus boettgeri]
MKAKGASPLRASHNVLPHAQLPPGSGLSALTDGGSLSDSSGSEYCSWHRGSRGSSPSHVRFQDESEHDVEERYRERQQQGPQSPSTSTNSAATQLSNGHKPWNQHLLSSGNSSQCGNYGSYIKNSGASQDSEIVPQVTWNASLGSKITQGGSINTPLGVKSSPHWILPSQPWRVHTELIRETYIGGDSTADLSGEDELVRAQKKSCPLTGSHRSSKNKLPNVHSDRTIHLDPAQQTEGTKKILDFERDTEINKKHVLESRTKNISLLLTPDKLSGSNAEWETAAKGSLPNTIVNSEIKTHYPESKIHLNCVDPGLACVRQCATLQKDTAITLNSREGPDILIPPDKTQTELKKLSVSSEAVSLTMPVRVPTPPIGKAPMGQLRTARFTARPERTGQHLSKPDVHIGDLEQMTPKEKDIQSHDVPQTKHQSNEEMDLNRHLSFSQIKMKKEVTKRSDKSKDESEQPEVTSGQPERGKTHRPKRPRDPEKNYLFKDKCKPKIIHATRDQEEKFNTSRGQLVREKDNVKMEQKQEANEEETPNSPMKPTTKKGHIRSGMRRILSSFGLKSRPRLERFQSSSLDQIFPSTSQSSEVCGSADDESYNKISSTGRMTKCPSLQSLKLMSQFPLPRKSSSVQNLLGKSEKSAGYVIGDANTAPRRALSVEDIGSPGMPRLLGRVAEVYPDGTRLLVIQRPPQSNFGFTISSVNGRPDSGKYVQDMSDPNTSKLYSGLLHVGDEILELNGTKVSTLGHDQLRSIMAEEFTLSLRVLHQRRTKC